MGWPCYRACFRRALPRLSPAPRPGASLFEGMTFTSQLRRKILELRVASMPLMSEFSACMAEGNAAASD